MKQVRHKRGDFDPSTGLYYWDTWYGKERWVNKAVLAKRRKAAMAYVLKWQKADPERHRAAQAKFRRRHGKRRNAEARGYRNQWKKKRRATDPLYALQQRCSARLRVFLGRLGKPKTEGVHPMIGCTYAELKVHLESLFKPGMTWQNAGYHGWHIDHKVPLKSAKTMADVRRLFHYTNLQPLWQKENFSKGSKYAA